MHHVGEYSPAKTGEYPKLVYTTQVNSAFRALWLVNSEVISKYYSHITSDRLSHIK